jgi:hypothetical protein
LDETARVDPFSVEGLLTPQCCACHAPLRILQTSIEECLMIQTNELVGVLRNARRAEATSSALYAFATCNRVIAETGMALGHRQHN